ncbi:hypothetical protein [Halobacterium litoreum]|uniref:Major facilitator superfamily (MFS) profile domain-containing protein n=1 Tax=Halobacterium litoreum TaxID=2039234 RepID=A0ABD5NCA2_9EURY|nr:hypothetical protein [Halobacterium litoreum]UHH14425.1 hypothetical protein LT972_05360 [Halobacterium litoreum]
MHTTKLLAGLALASILGFLVGAATALPGAVETTAGVATAALAALVVVGVVFAGIGGAGQAGDRGRTPYW